MTLKNLIKSFNPFLALVVFLLGCVAVVYYVTWPDTVVAPSTTTYQQTEQPESNIVSPDQIHLPEDYEFPDSMKSQPPSGPDLSAFNNSETYDDPYVISYIETEQGILALVCQLFPDERGALTRQYCVASLLNAETGLADDYGSEAYYHIYSVPKFVEWDAERRQATIRVITGDAGVGTIRADSFQQQSGLIMPEGVLPTIDLECTKDNPAERVDCSKYDAADIESAKQLLEL